MRPCGEAIRPLVSFFLALAICLVWVVYSKNDILEADVRCFFFMSGTLYANMSCRLIVAQVSISPKQLLTEPVKLDRQKSFIFVKRYCFSVV